MLHKLAPREICQQEEHRGDQHDEGDSAGGAGPLRDHRDLLRDSHHVGLGMLNVADETGGDFLGVETQKRCVAAKKWHEVEPIRNQIVVVGLDHFDVMRRQMSLADDLLASHAFAFAGFRNQVAERRLGLGAAGSEIRTIEGLARGDQLSAIQEAFVDCGGAQCGICTPGMVMAAAALLERHVQPDERQIRAGLSGNLCRCTGYARIFEAVLRACQATGVRP